MSTTTNERARKIEELMDRYSPRSEASRVVTPGRVFDTMDRYSKMWMITATVKAVAGWVRRIARRAS